MAAPMPISRHLPWTRYMASFRLTRYPALIDSEYRTIRKIFDVQSRGPYHTIRDSFPTQTRITSGVRRRLPNPHTRHQPHSSQPTTTTSSSTATSFLSTTSTSAMAPPKAALDFLDFVNASPTRTSSPPILLTLLYSTLPYSLLLYPTLPYPTLP